MAMLIRAFLWPGPEDAGIFLYFLDCLNASHLWK